MRCKKIISKLGAYVDGELPERLFRKVESHLASCKTCRQELEEIRGMDELLQGSLPVPPVPEGLSARIVAGARRRGEAGAPRMRFPHPAWNPVQWAFELSASMRFAAAVTVLLALATGFMLDGGGVGGSGVSTEPSKDLYGLEWFDPAPPGSIGSIYMAVADQLYEEGNGE